MQFVSSTVRNTYMTRGRLAIAVALASFVAIAIGVVYAAIPDSAGVIHACYKGANGQLRVVDSPASCLPSEKQLLWSQSGPQGPQGPIGPQGPTGPQGPAGPGNTYQVEAFQNLLTGQTVTLTAMCNTGDVVIGGFTRAFGVTNLTGDRRFAEIAPIGPAPLGQGWTATATGQTAAPDFLDVFAVCLHM